MVHQEERQRNGMNLGLRRFRPRKHHEWHSRPNDDAAGLPPGKIGNRPVQNIGRLDVRSDEHIRSLHHRGVEMDLRSAAKRLRGTSRANGPSR